MTSKQSYKLSDLCKLKQGRYLAPKDMKEAPYGQFNVPVIGGNGILGYTDKPSHIRDLVLVTCRGSKCGLLQWVKGPVWVSNNAIACDSGSQENNHFLRYLFATLDFRDVISGSAQPQITLGALGPKTVCVTDDVVQRQKATRLLMSMDSLLENLYAQNITLESIAQTLFKSWFVNFDPVHAKAAGQQPEGLSEELAALFPSEFEESELGFIPKGWDNTVLKSVCEKVANGATPKRNIKAYWQDGSIPWLKTGEFDDGFLFDSEEKITPAGYENSSVKLFAENTVLIALYGATVSKMAILGKPATFNQAATALRGNQDFGQWLIYLWLRHKRDWIVSMASGGAQQNISKAIIESVQVVIAPPGILRAFNQVVSPLFESIKNNEESRQVLSSLRDEILPRLISGKLRIEEAEEAVAEVLPQVTSQEQAA